MGTGPLPGKTGLGEVKILDFETMELLVELVAPGGVRYGDPSWSPDSDFVVFDQRVIVDSVVEGSTMGRLDLGTGEVVTIVDEYECVALPGWGK